MKISKSTIIAGAIGFGLFFAGNVPVAQAADCFKVDSVFEEGIAFKCEEVKQPTQTTKRSCLDLQSFYTEGNPYSCEEKTKVRCTDPAYCRSEEFFSEGPYDAEMQVTVVASYKNKGLQAQPAAGDRER